MDVFPVPVSMQCFVAGSRAQRILNRMGTKANKLSERSSSARAGKGILLTDMFFIGLRRVQNQSPP